MTGAERNLRLARSKVESLQGQMERLKALEAQGTVSRMEVTQPYYVLAAAQAELKLAALETDVLEKLR
jgi:outer membrane protein TolC